MTTVLFPAAVGLACLLLSLMLFARRRAVALENDADGASTDIG